jgi:hypothetical protein
LPKRSSSSVITLESASSEKKAPGGIAARGFYTHGAEGGSTPKIGSDASVAGADSGRLSV